MIDMRKCIICGTCLSESIIRNKQRKCYNCCDQEHLNVLFSPSNLGSIFCKKWPINLLTRYNEYLPSRDLPSVTEPVNIDDQNE